MFCFLYRSNNELTTKTVNMNALSQPPPPLQHPQAPPPLQHPQLPPPLQHPQPSPLPMQSQPPQAQPHQNITQQMPYSKFYDKPNMYATPNEMQPGTMPYGAHIHGQFIQGPPAHEPLPHATPQSQYPSNQLSQFQSPYVPKSNFS